MREQITLLTIVLTICGVSTITRANSPNQFDPVPEYCVGFSLNACTRIKAVIESGVRPAYCVPGFGRVDSGLNLTPEQLRICYAQPPAPLSPDTQRAQDANQARQRQMIEDAKAMVRESWSNYRNLIEEIEIGYKCDVVDQLSASVAIRKIQVVMQRELNKAGLIGDSTMSIQDFTINGVQAGKNAAESGACTRMTPASRGRLRAMVSDLMQ